MSGFDAETDKLFFNIEQFCLSNGASDFVNYFLKYNYALILEGKVAMILAPVDAALKRLVDKTGKPLDEISNLPEGIDVFNNFLSSTGFSYDPLYRAINGTTYGKTHHDLPALKSSRTITLGNLSIHIIDAVIRRNQQQIESLSRANQEFIRRRTGIIGGDVVAGFDDLPNPVIRQINLNLSLSDIINNCRASAKFNRSICDSEDFWNEKLRKDHPNQQSMIGNSWKETYKMLTGKLYTFGSNSQGQLGLGAVPVQYEPRLVQSLINVSSVACGGYHTAAISTGKLYTWGNGGSGQLGHGNFENRGVPWLVEGLNNVSIVACGSYHTAVISNNRLYTFGDGSFGRLGHGDAQSQNRPVLVESLDNVTAVSCGLAHTAVISNGLLYTFGGGASGRLGHGDEQDLPRPKLVEGLDNVTFVACSLSHTAAISNGRLYTFGFGEGGKLGHGDNQNQLRPVLVEGLDNVTFVSCGVEHTAAISSGRLYTFGTGGTGQLGHGDNQDYLRPKLVERLDNVTVVACGSTYTAVVANRELYTFGSGMQGELGQGQEQMNRRTNVPREVRHLYGVIFVTAGTHHTAVIASQDDLNKQ